MVLGAVSRRGGEAPQQAQGARHALDLFRDDVAVGARGAEVAAELGRSGAKAAFVAAELSDPATPEMLVRECVERFGRIDYVVSPAVGGIIRDVLGQEASIILRREIYVTASLFGAIVFTVMMANSADRLLAGAVGGGIVFLVRGLAISFGWSLPTYRARPGRQV